MIKFLRTNESGKTERLEAFENGCWVDMISPTDDEVELVCAATALPEEFLKAALDEEETARIEREDGVTLCLLDTPTITETDDGDSYGTIPIAIILSDMCVVTVSLRENPVLLDFAGNRIAVNILRPEHFLLTFMMGNAKRFLSNLRQIDKKSLRVQAELHRSMKNKELIQLLSLENSLVYFSTSLSANVSVYNKLEKLPAIAGNEEYKDLFDDVVIETRQAVEMCNIYRDILSGTMDAYASVISNNVNIVMKLLTVITMIITIPTLIASLWGMNVNVPFGNTAWGFWVIVAISVVITAVASVLIVRSTNSIRIKSQRIQKPKRRRGRD